MKLQSIILFLSFSLSLIHCGSIAGLTGTSTDNNEKTSQALLLSLLAANSITNQDTYTSVSQPDLDFRIEFNTPSNSQSSVSTDPKIYVKFSSEVDTITVNTSSVSLFESTNQISFKNEFDSANSFSIKPNEPLKTNTAYTVKINKSVTGKNGTSLSDDFSWSFTTLESELVFKIESNTPSNSQSNISTDPRIYVKFSSEVDTATVSSSSVSLYESTNQLTFKIEYDSVDSFFIIPYGLLKINKTYTVKISKSVTGKNGKSLSDDYSWSFTTFNSEPDSGSVITLAGSGSSGNTDATGASASFSSPQHLVMNVAETFLYITDTGNHRIRTVSLSSGTVSTAAGSTLGYTAATGVAARFNSPKGIFRIAGDTFFISDSGNNSIRRMTVGNAVTNNFGTNTNAAGFVISTSTTAQRYRNPEGFAVDFLSGNQYVVDTGNHCIRRSTNASTGSSNSVPNTSCFAGASPSGGLGTSGFVNGLTTAARFNNPKGIAIDYVGNIFVADSGNHSIRMITSAGVGTTIAGSGSAGYTNGTGSEATFNNPSDIAIDGLNAIYVADTGNCSIRKLVLDSSKTSAYVTTFSGATTDVTSGNCGFVNGTRLSARFNSPRGLWVATNGKVYVTDMGNHSIRIISE